MTLGNVLHCADGPGLFGIGGVDLPGQDVLDARTTGQVQAVVAIDDQEPAGLWVTPDTDDLAEQRVIGLGVLQGPGDTSLAFALASSLELQSGGIGVDLSDRSFPHLGIARHGVATIHRCHRASFIGHRAGRPGDRSVGKRCCLDEVLGCGLHIGPGVIKATLGLNALLLP